MKTYYELLGVDRGVSADEIKRAFRREIARYHPDKVQHLGAEFQEIAAVRAAELTEAYRVLMDEDARSQYDESLRQSAGPRPAGPPPAAAPRPASTPKPQGDRPHPAPEPETPPPPDRRFQQERAHTSDFVRKAGMSRVRRAIESAAGSFAPLSIPGFDAAFDIKGKGGLFKKAEPPVRLLIRFVPEVDAAAVESSWPAAVRALKGDTVVCLLLLGAAGVAPARELSHAVSDQRRKSRGAGPVLIPVDVRDWEALFPPEAPASVRAVVQWLREQK